MPDNQESPSKELDDNLHEVEISGGRKIIIHQGNIDLDKTAMLRGNLVKEAEEYCIIPLSQLTTTQQALDSAVEAKNSAYNERNQLVAALSKIFPSWLGMHDLSDSTWDFEWRNIVYINAPTGQLSWHLHDNDMIYFQHLKFDENVGWDGHSTEEKYRRLAALASIKLGRE